MRQPDPLPFTKLLAPDALTSRNRILFDYWQSLRTGHALPNRADFDPARVRPVLSRLSLFDARAGERLTCRLAGSTIRQALGFELAGRDLDAYTPAALRRQRLDSYHRILSGMALRSTRTALLTSGRQMTWQELVLPFGDRQEDGSQQVLIMADFARFEYREGIASPRQSLGVPAQMDYVRL